MSFTGKQGVRCYQGAGCKPSFMSKMEFPTELASSVVALLFVSVLAGTASAATFSRAATGSRGIKGVWYEWREDRRLWKRSLLIAQRVSRRIAGGVWRQLRFVTL